MNLVRFTAALLGAAALTGCSGGRAGVEGRVTHDGQPIPLGTITFLPTAAKGIKCGGRIENGRYQIEAEFGPIPGAHRVEIRWDKPTGQKYKNEFGEVFDRTQEGLPEKYNTRSELTAEIQSGMNTLNFDLEK